MIDGLFEAHIDAIDLERSLTFYGDVLGLELGHLNQKRRVALYWVGGRGEAMLGLWEKPAEVIQPQHYAFRASADDILERSVPFLKATSSMTVRSIRSSLAGCRRWRSTSAIRTGIRSSSSRCFRASPGRSLA